MKILGNHCYFLKFSPAAHLKLDLSVYSTYVWENVPFFSRPLDLKGAVGNFVKPLFFYYKKKWFENFIWMDEPPGVLQSSSNHCQSTSSDLWERKSGAGDLITPSELRDIFIDMIQLLADCW